MNNLVSEYISTRICHDIIGNIGAVSNAVELLEEDDTDFISDIKSILKTSSTVLTARMKFFRLAFGLDNNGLNDISLIENTIKSYLNTIGGKNPPELDFNIKEAIFPKVMMLLTMMISDVMIKGGTIHIGLKDNKLVIGVDETVRIAEDKLKQMLEVLRGTLNLASAQDAPILYLLELCKKYDLKIEYTTSPVLYFVVG